MTSKRLDGRAKTALRERVLAFDVRIHPTQALADLAPDYRRRALLNPQAPNPISADETIWPQIEVLQFEDFLRTAASAMKWQHDPSSLCDSNNLLLQIPERWLSERPSEIHSNAWLIALSVSQPAATYLASLRATGLLYEPSLDVETLLHSGWKLLGYDVADKMLYSPLLNDALGLEENESIAGPFRSSVNDYALFSQFEVAERFSKVATAQIKEHAPYFSVGLWAHPSNR